MDRALQDETIATIASSVEKKAENVAIEMDGAFYKGEFVKTYRYINAEYSRSHFIIPEKVIKIV